MKFRKKPVVIEAFQFWDGFFEDPEVPDEFKEACCRKNDAGATFERPHIHTLEGVHWITLGDWIVKGIVGEFYPHKPDFWEIAHEPVEEEVLA